MAARKVKRTKSGIGFIILIAVFICGVLIFKTMEKGKERDALQRQYDQVRIQIENANIEREQIEDRIRYQQTDEYIRDMAAEEIGLVDPDTVIFVPIEE